MSPEIIKKGFTARVSWSVAELSAAQNRPPPLRQNRAHWNEQLRELTPGNSEYKHCVEWTGLPSAQAGFDLIRTGWTEGANEIWRLSKPVPAPKQGRDVRRRPVWSDNGDDLNIDRAMRGEWDRAWRRSARRSGVGTPIIEVWSSWGGNSGLKAGEMFWSGAVALVLTDWLEQAGYRVELNAAIFEILPAKSALVLLRVKEASEPLRMPELAAVLCHGGVFRTAGFRAMLEGPFNLGSGMGSPRSFAEAEHNLGDLWPDPSPVLIERVTSEESAAQLLKELVSKFSEQSAA